MGFGVVAVSVTIATPFEAVETRWSIFVAFHVAFSGSEFVRVLMMLMQEMRLKDVKKNGDYEKGP